MKEMMKKNISIFICALLLFVAIIISISTSVRQNDLLLSQETRIAELENKIEVQKSFNATDDAQAVIRAAGLDVERVKIDDRIANDFFKFVFTWDSLAKYNQIRDSLEDDYGLDGKDTFLIQFLPEIADFDTNGHRYNMIDINGYNLTYEKMKSYVIDIADNCYTYFAVIEVSSVNQHGAEGIGKVAAVYTIDDEQKISNISGYIID